MTKLDVDKDLIRELAALLEETGLSEIELADDGKRLRVARPAAPNPAASAGAAAAAAPDEAVSVDEPAAPPDYADHPGVVLSPMVGTVYVGHEPGAPPFVKVGDTVTAGQPLLIIEAMKTMNQIPAPRDGRVVEILVLDAQPVEFNDPLLIIE